LVQDIIDFYIKQYPNMKDLEYIKCNQNNIEIGGSKHKEIKAKIEKIVD